ncbi:hypothetical protein ACJVDH_14025 [Pedobacter sp. AW1-32]|uniref:hypothetical protein n=1 Tax=Pedobacter sp. AW1-32 TaxID=3383026 RepID=UPI003FEDD8AE
MITAGHFLKTVLCICLFISLNNRASHAQQHAIEFYDGTFNFETDSSLQIHVPNRPEKSEILKFYTNISALPQSAIIEQLKIFRAKYELNDWIFYQLIRKTAEEISPKAQNYFRYTLYKWYLLCKTGYDARLAVGDNQVIFYVRNEEDISDIPYFEIYGRKYTCLNYHDYGKLFKRADAYVPIAIDIGGADNAFSYKINRMPDFKPANYSERDLAFNYKHTTYHFKLKVNKDVSSIFANYPGVDFETYFNIPVSQETYSSLIPVLKKNTVGMSKKKGVDYLMRFTRYAFLYEDDEQNFGKEKRLSPEETLLNQYSDCDDRAALFFYLVKEIYNLPMVAVLYPTHLTMAVGFDQAVGNFIVYKGKKYSFCEPTPQVEKLNIGQLSSTLKNVPYQIVYAYEPIKR